MFKYIHMCIHIYIYIKLVQAGLPGFNLLACIVSLLMHECNRSTEVYHNLL